LIARAHYCRFRLLRGLTHNIQIDGLKDAHALLLGMQKDAGIVLLTLIY
jgi:hypothetical protein